MFLEGYPLEARLHQRTWLCFFQIFYGMQVLIELLEKLLLKIYLWVD